MPAITERSAVDLAAAIRRRELTSAEVVGAHVQRLRATHARINAVVAERYDDALTQARACDHRIAGGALRGAPADDLPPLFGVPFTVKESIAVRGMPQSAGVQARAGQTSIQNAAAVQRLIDAGAIPLGVTNVSELTLWIESDNPVYGRTNNPYDQSRTAGGSSGGEAATVAIGGSPFGIGADIGGSIRIPALFCGVFGHKPSSGLVPTTGLWPPVAEAAEPLLTVGPITRRAEDLLPLLRILSGGSSAASSADSIAGALDDTGDVSLVGLTVTTVSGSSLRPFSRALQNARERAVGALASAGATVRVVNLPSWRQALLPFLAMLHDDRANGSGPTHAALGISETSRLDLFQLLTGANGHTLPTRLA
ncbi:MAG: amidase, partial [Solirubrobacteraceae bacterium]